MNLDVRGSGHSWAVFKGEERISRYHNGRDAALTTLTNIERKQKTAVRPCLCCGARFKSTGAHHRMCDTCRRKNEGLI